MKAFLGCGDLRSCFGEIKFFIAEDSDFSGCCSSMVDLARSNDFSVETFTSSSFSYDSILEDFIGIAAGWHRLLDVSKFSTLYVIHDSLLPELRGFNPTVTALTSGSGKVAATIFRADQNVDSGDVIFQMCKPVTDFCKIKDALELVAKLYEEVFSLFLYEMCKSNLFFLPQRHDLASYSVWRDSVDFIINWGDCAENVKRQIDATGEPYEGALTFLKGVSVRVYDVEILDKLNVVNHKAGKVFSLNGGEPIVLCGIGALKLKRFIIQGNATLSLKSRFDFD